VGGGRFYVVAGCFSYRGCHGAFTRG
jgi:hypothetical protein